MKALVLSGGAEKSIYQAGVLKHILGNLNKNYDILCAVSGGSLNAAFISQYKSDNLKKCSEDLQDLWFSIKKENIYKNWSFFGRLSFLWKSSMFNSAPLMSLIKERISLSKIRDTNKIVNVGAVSLSSGKYRIFDQNNDDFLDAVVASACFPGFLSPVKIGNQLWIDGGLKQMSPIQAAIDNGATEIDVIFTSPKIRIKKFLENPNGIDVLKRSFDLSTDKIMSNDIEKSVIYNKMAKLGFTDKKFITINIIQPLNNLTDNTLEFDQLKMKEMFYKGYEDAISYFNNLI